MAHLRTPDIQALMAEAYSAMEHAKRSRSEQAKKTVDLCLRALKWHAAHLTLRREIGIADGTSVSDARPMRRGDCPCDAPATGVSSARGEAGCKGLPVLCWGFREGTLRVIYVENPLGTQRVLAPYRHPDDTPMKIHCAYSDLVDPAH